MTEDRWCTSDGRYVATYCSPRDVMKAIRVVDYHDPNFGIADPSDALPYPDYDELVFRICAKEDELDYYTGDSWRPKRVVDYQTNLGTYWKDINGFRMDYWVHGGYAIQLNQNILPWDTSKGDRLELRTLQNTWKDVSELLNYTSDDVGTALGYFDYEKGRLYLQASFLQPKENSVRITYRYGRDTPVPPAISRCCALMVGLTILNEDLYLTRLGQGGDLGGQKNDMKKAMQDEIDKTIAMYRRFTPVYSLYQ